MPSNWENIQKTMKTELSEAATMAKKYLKIGKVKLNMMEINNSMNDTYRELGVKVYDQITDDTKEDIRLNPKVKSLIAKINQLKQSINDEELEIKVIKKGPPAQTKTN